MALAMLASVGGIGEARAQGEDAPQEPKKAWYERIHLRGYTQIRYNRLGETNPELRNDQGDRSIGGSGGLFLRRARLVLTADLGDVAAMYIQPDFASAIDESLNVGQVRDWWGEIFLDRQKAFRIRVGQQKVPYGWELMQSSGNRVPLDRTDALNSAFANERDVGAFFMFDPPSVRRRFKYLVDSGLKGSGDYGMTAVGISNGQPVNTRERNANKHFFARVAFPFQIGRQIVELAGGGYTGLFVPRVDDGITANREYRDLRLHGTFVLYPQPFGLQAEYNAGVGPELDGARVRERGLAGGYVMAMLLVPTQAGVFVPFARVHHYDGGKKFETNAPRHEIRELNAGVEWQIARWVELTTELMASERTVNGVTQEGRLFRLQLQFNY